MKKHLRLIYFIARFWLIRSLEFRVDFIVWSVISLTWAFVGLFATNLVFGQVTTIAGWDRTSVLLLMACQAMFNSLLWIFVLPSFMEFTEIIKDGRFDFQLAKPINTRFLVTFRKFTFPGIFRIIAMAASIYYIASSSQLNIDLFSFIGFIILLLSGLVIYYCLFFSITTLCIWVVDMHNLIDIFDILVVMGRYPTYIFQSGLRLIFFYILPIAFVATFPIQVLLGKGSLLMVVMGVVMAAAFYILSDKFWHFALRHYSSASS